MKEVFVLLCCLPGLFRLNAGVAQEIPAKAKDRPQVRSVVQSVLVTTALEPFPLAESYRSVEFLVPEEQAQFHTSVVDVLRSDASLNLQARAGNGVQADLSLRGTTFEQSLVLLNGLRINDPETGHLNLDIPVPLDAVSRIDVLHGSGSTFYGSDAIGGAVNLLTLRPASRLSLIASAGAGSYGSLEQHVRAGYAAGRVAEQFTGSRDTSNGFMADRNYSSNAAALESWLTLKPGTTDVLLAASDRPYGANRFYGPYNSWERTKGWFASVQQQVGARTAVSLGYRRHSDLFVLFADRPEIYENNHVTTSYEGAVRRVDGMGSKATVSYGLEADGNGIRSNTLKQHGRNQEAGYANVNLRALGRFSLSVGAREEIFSGGGTVFSPHVAAAYALASTVRLRGAVGHGFRLPTYVDLYYADPTTIGNPDLKPESSWSYEAGADWTPGSGRVTVSATGFRLQQKEVIDYSKAVLATDALTFAQRWQAVNIQSLNLTGAETTVRMRLAGRQQLQLSYTAVRAGDRAGNRSGNRSGGRISEYAFNYAAQNAIFAWTGEMPGAWGRQVTARTQVNVVQKTTQRGYPLWDFSVSRNRGLVRPYIRLLNLSNTGYQEIPQVPMQGRTVMGGAAFYWARQ